jgi:predicted RNA-binding protein with PIN domain
VTASEQGPDPAQRGSTSLPEAVRLRVVALTAEVLPQVPSLPTPLRRVAAFAPGRRARLGGTPIGAALADDEFRERVATQVAAARPDLEAALAPTAAPLADPVDAAAMLWLARPDGWEPSYADAVARLEAEPVRDDTEVERLREQLAAAEQATRDLRAQQRATAEELRSEVATLRRKLGEARAARKADADERAEAIAAAEHSQARADAAVATADAEARRLRGQVEQLQAQLSAARSDSRAERDEATVRARLLLDTLVEAGQGLRRELALPPVSGTPGERLEQDLARAGTRDPSSAGSLGPASPALLEQYLAMPGARLVVDGYNVTKTAWPQSPLEAQRIRLLQAVAPLAARSGAETTVVFDGAASTARAVANAPRGVKVLFSPEGVIADDVIRDLVAAEPEGRVVVVVTSDRELADDVRRAGARAMQAEALIRLLA